MGLVITSPSKLIIVGRVNPLSISSHDSISINSRSLHPNFVMHIILLFKE
jgi:hypothetical protein